MVRPDVRYREEQLDFLEAFVDADPKLSPPILFIEGPHGSGKTHTLKKFFACNEEIMNILLPAKDLIYSKSTCQRLATCLRQLLLKQFPSVETTDLDPFEAEDVYLLQKFINKLFIRFNHLVERVNLYVILDGLDDNSQVNLETPTQLMALPGSILPQAMIQLRLIISFSKSSFLSNYSTFKVPTIFFPKYKPLEIEYIVSQTPGFSDDPLLLEKMDEIGCGNTEQFRSEIFEKYIHFLIESLIVYTGYDPTALIDIMRIKWRCFVRSLNQENIKNTVQLYKSNLELFNKPNERLIPQTSRSDQNSLSGTGSVGYSSHSLCFMAKYLLIAAYLASYLNHRYDSKVFSKKSHLRGGRSSYGRRSKPANNPRYLQPSGFSLERMLAIFQSIYPVRVSKELSPDFFQRDVHMKANVEVYENVSELITSQLLTGLNMHKLGYLHERLKFKVNVTWDYILLVAGSVDFDISEYFSDVVE
ncbi:origin recognition complex subunit 5 [Kluyveromyces lactis]|uniref:KLLA0C02607p n=1 Tax=Kluyveromyces lactis (strain ATCC 8585 / CBS 2359 / DSM 70799 / NBRC 1267 / NRRL Y-1140 / WM37) TaxID=284590 RepID=Q6CUS6_KLULA|nr:uncharacterized protein KLLA0_C02607g [Kluyveromyces lactis]CAH01164.1 KLLA0C02607p [Kluyveromyces lactis]|eukprot:XP_452313.1 uncharacterized protein KLLA0_C02607g [Kluyveromyces lactis]